MPDEKRFELSELEIETVGIVDEPAIQKKFFLMKSDEREIVMTDEIKVEEITSTEQTSSDADNQNLLRKIWERLNKQDEVEATDTPAAPELDEIEEAVATVAAADPDLVKAARRSVAVEKEDEPEVETPDVSTLVQKAVESEIAALQKATNARIETLTKAHQTEVEALKVRLEKAESETDAAKADAEERKYIAKAAEYRATPVAGTELGQHLYTLAKAVEPEEYTFWETLLKAMDAQLGAAGIFDEFGTALTGDALELHEKVEKAAKAGGKSYADAVLELTEAEQAQLLAESRGGK